jgi:hypothetical protein
LVKIKEGGKHVKKEVNKHENGKNAFYAHPFYPPDGSAEEGRFINTQTNRR